MIDKLSKYGDYLASLLLGTLIVTLLMNDYPVWISVWVGVIWLLQSIRNGVLEHNASSTVVESDSVG